MTAEEIVRFTHDPRTTAFAMLKNDRVEVLEREVRPSSALLGRRFRRAPAGGRDRRWLGWLAIALIGGLPYVFQGGAIKSPIDAYSESMSGFTTTGSSVMSDISSHGRGILFWRSITQ